MLAMPRDTHALIARDALVRLAATHLYLDDATRAAAHELAPQPHWQRRRAALEQGVALAQAAIERHGGAREAAAALGL